MFWVVLYCTISYFIPVLEHHRMVVSSGWEPGRILNVSTVLGMLHCCGSQVGWWSGIRCYEVKVIAEHRWTLFPHLIAFFLHRSAIHLEESETDEYVQFWECSCYWP